MVTVASIEALEQVIEKKQSLFKKLLLQEIKARLKSGEVIAEFQERVLRVIRGMQALYFSGPVDDPTAPINYESEIRDEVARQINFSASKIKAGQTTFNLTVLSDSFLGLDTKGPTSPSDKKPMKWMAYFLLGDFDDNLYWVPAAAAKALKMKDKAGNLGRFGDGFLISPAGGQESIDRKNEALSNKGVAEKIVKHPQSGKGGDNWFEHVISNAYIEEAILKPALEAALQKLAG